MCIGGPLCVLQEDECVFNFKRFPLTKLINISHLVKLLFVMACSLCCDCADLHKNKAVKFFSELHGQLLELWLFGVGNIGAQVTTF